MDLQRLLLKSKESAFYRTVLNWVLSRMIPFNKPHKFEIMEVDADHLKVRLPYIRRNFNHIRGIHACALATVTEYCSGLMLISKLDPKKYRLIMQRMEMDYHFQGKQDAYASFSIDNQWMSEMVYEPLQGNDAVVVPCEVRIHDKAGNHLTTGKVFWQVKDWQKVRTKVSGKG